MECWVELFNRVTEWNLKVNFSYYILGHFVIIFLLKDLQVKI